MMKSLLKNKPISIFLAVIVLTFAGLIVAWQSALYTLNHMAFKDVTPTQLAAAMRKDEFWSSNRFNTLVFDGKVKSISTNGSKATLEFETSDTDGASCEVNDSNTKFEVGKTYKFGVETYQAERQPDGVLLHDCTALST